MTGDQQRPLGRMTFELPPKGGKGARHWEIKARSREEHFRQKEQPLGIPCGQSVWTTGEQKSSEYDCTLGARKSRNRSWQMLEPDQQGFLGRNWNRKGSKQVNHMT